MLLIVIKTWFAKVAIIVEKQCLVNYNAKLKIEITTSSEANKFM